MIHVGNAGTVWVCGKCAKDAPGRDLGAVTDDVGSLRRVATLDERQPPQVEYLAPCPWCGDDTTARRLAVGVRLVVDSEAEAQARGLGDVREARVVVDGRLVPAAAHVARLRSEEAG